MIPENWFMPVRFFIGSHYLDVPGFGEAAKLLNHFSWDERSQQILLKRHNEVVNKWLNPSLQRIKEEAKLFQLIEKTHIAGGFGGDDNAQIIFSKYQATVFAATWRTYVLGVEQNLLPSRTVYENVIRPFNGRSTEPRPYSLADGQFRPAVIQEIVAFAANNEGIRSDLQDLQNLCRKHTRNDWRNANNKDGTICRECPSCGRLYEWSRGKRRKPYCGDDRCRRRYGTLHNGLKTS